MATLSEQFEEWTKKEIRLRPPRRIRKAVAHDAFLAGAAAEREAIIEIVADNYPSETAHAMMAVARINHLIRQRGEAGERPEEEK